MQYLLTEKEFDGLITKLPLPHDTTLIMASDQIYQRVIKISKSEIEELLRTHYGPIDKVLSGTHCHIDWLE